MPDNANQQTFYVHKLEHKPPFVQIDLNNWLIVHRELKGGVAFSLWLWYASNADDFNDNIYSVTITHDLGISKQSYYNARDKLKAYGYLIPSKYKHYEYHFYERTPVRPEWRIKVKNKPSEEKELQRLYCDLVHQNKPVEDLTLEEWWLYNRGKTNKWKEDWKF